MTGSRAAWWMVLGPVVGLHCQALLEFENATPDAASDAGPAEAAVVDEAAITSPSVDAGADVVPFCFGIDGSCEDFDPPLASADAGCSPYGGGVAFTRVEAFDAARSPPNVLVSRLEPGASFAEITGCDFKFFGRKRLVASFDMQTDLPANAKAYLALVRYLGPSNVKVDVHLFRRETGDLSLVLDIGASIQRTSVPEYPRPVGNWTRYTIDVDAEQRVARLSVEGTLVSEYGYAADVGAATSVDFVFAPELSYMQSPTDAAVSARFDNVVIDPP